MHHADGRGAGYRPGSARGKIRYADETGGALHDRLAVLGAIALLDCVATLASGELTEARPQPETGFTYATKLRKAEARMDWSEPAQVLERRIRAFNPWPVAWCISLAKRTRIWQAAPQTESTQRGPGTVLKQAEQASMSPPVNRRSALAGTSATRWKRRMSVAEYLNRQLPP